MDKLRIDSKEYKDRFVDHCYKLQFMGWFANYCYYSFTKGMDIDVLRNPEHDAKSYLYGLG